MVEDIEDTDDESPVGDALLQYDKKKKDKQSASKKPVYSRPKFPKLKIKANTMPESGSARNNHSRGFERDREAVQASPIKRVQSSERNVQAKLSNTEISRSIPSTNNAHSQKDEHAEIDARFAFFEHNLKASLVGQIETVVNNVLSGSVKQTLLKEFVDKLQASVIQEVKRSFQAFFSAQVKETLKASIKGELEKELGKELRTEFSREIIQARDITSRLSMAYGEFANDVTDKVTRALDQKVRDEFNNELRKAREVSDIIKGSLEPLKRRIKEELRNDISQDIKRQLPALFRQEIKDELIREIKDEIGNSVKDEIIEEIVESTNKKIDEHVISYAKQKSRMAMLNAENDTPMHLVFIDFNNLWEVAKKYTTNYPNIKYLLQLLRELLRKYDDQLTPDRVSGFIYFSRYHETEVNRVLSFKFEDDPELEAIGRQFEPEIESERKMMQNGQVTKMRDVDVLLASQASAMIAKNSHRIATVTLVSGDGDLNPVLAIAKQNGIHTIVFSFKHGTSSSLTYNADEIQFLDMFPSIPKKSTSQPREPSPQ